MKGLHPSESEIQIALFQWAALHEREYPELRLMFHPANGGLRNKAVAGQMKAMGVKPGVPDICLPVAGKGNSVRSPFGVRLCLGWHSLYIELKAKKGHLSPLQKNYIEALRNQGHCVLVCDGGWQQASEWIVNYLEGRI